MKFKRSHAVALALALAACAAGLAWWGRPTSVEVTRLAQQPLVRTLQFTARVATPARVDLGTTLTGRVARVLVNEGDDVEAAQVLVALEVDEAQAALRQAEASLRQSDAGVRAAERDLPRTEELVARSFFSQQKLDDARKATDVARAQREAARAAVEAARARLAQHVVRAPDSGQVLVRSVEPGQIVQAGKPLLTVSVRGPMELEAQVDERFLGQLRAGQPAKVLADAYPQRPFDAKVLRLAPSVNAQSGSVEVRLAVEGVRPEFLREDMTLSVEVQTGRRADARTLPLRALRGAATDGEGRAGEVLVIEAGRAQVRSVKLGLRTLKEVEVTDGLDAATEVILDPTSTAVGTRVRSVAHR